MAHAFEHAQASMQERLRLEREAAADNLRAERAAAEDAGRAAAKYAEQQAGSAADAAHAAAEHAEQQAAEIEGLQAQLGDLQLAYSVQTMQLASVRAERQHLDGQSVESRGAADLAQQELQHMQEELQRQLVSQREEMGKQQENSKQQQQQV